MSKFIVFNLISNLIFSISGTFIPNANSVVLREFQTHNEILEQKNLYCHIQSARVKTFESTYNKMKRLNIDELYNVYDLIGFRYVFYTKEDLLKFYHHMRFERDIFRLKNYIHYPKKNGYKAFHLQYKNVYKDCPIRFLECQLYIIDDYYNALYGTAQYHKNYTHFY
jgi:hypothetical protein